MAQQRALAWLAVEHDPRSHADVAAARVAVTLSWVQKHMVAGYQQLRGVKNTKGHVNPTTVWQQGIRWKSITLSTRPAAATGASPDAGGWWTDVAYGQQVPTSIWRKWDKGGPGGIPPAAIPMERDTCVKGWYLFLEGTKCRPCLVETWESGGAQRNLSHKVPWRRVRLGKD